MPNSIFINYRRNDSQHAAIAIASALKYSFVEGEVFIDRCSIDGGELWPEIIRDAVEQSEVMISVIGKSWLKISDQYGRRRIDHPEDWVRLELLRAFERTIPVIPVLLDDAEMPVSQAVDGALGKLCIYKAQRIRTDSWESDLSCLFDVVKKHTAALVREHHTAPNAIQIARPLPVERERRPLSHAEISDHLKYLTCWRQESNYHDWAIGGIGQEIARAYEFSTFQQALKFMSFAATEIDLWSPHHHPRWENQWRSVKVWFTTWDVGCRVTELDIETAHKLEDLYIRFKPEE